MRIWVGCSKRAQLAEILDLFAEDSWRNVYAGEREVRPAFALVTTKAVHRPVRRSHEVAKVEARSAKADLQELRPASHQARPPHDRFGWAQPSVECLRPED